MSFVLLNINKKNFLTVGRFLKTTFQTCSTRIQFSVYSYSYSWLCTGTRTQQILKSGTRSIRTRSRLCTLTRTRRFVLVLRPVHCPYSYKKAYCFWRTPWRQGPAWDGHFRRCIAVTCNQGSMGQSPGPQRGTRIVVPVTVTTVYGSDG